MLTLTLAALLAVPQEAEKIRISETKYAFDLVSVPGGAATLGGGRQGELKPFWMSRTEATYQAFLEYFENRDLSKVDGITRPSPPYEPPNGKMGAKSHAAVGMRYHGAIGFCNWLSKRTGQRFRLPTEAEWEYAARAGAKGDRYAGIDDYAWYAANSANKTHEVGGKKPNAFGLHDMLGNVWEYCLEPHTIGDFGPVLRGGAWNSKREELLFSHRQRVLPTWFSRDPNRPRSTWWLTDARFVGFRVVRMGSAADQKAQDAYRDKIKLSEFKIGARKPGFLPITGKVTNAGDRTLWELELTVFFYDVDDKPMLEDLKARATFNTAYPVMVNSWHEGEHARPLKPGASRTFSILAPEPWDVDDDPTKAGAFVTGVRFGPN